MATPAYLRNGCFDVLAVNDLGRAIDSLLYDQAHANPKMEGASTGLSALAPFIFGLGRSPNSARFLVLDPAG